MIDSREQSAISVRSCADAFKSSAITVAEKNQCGSDPSDTGSNSHSPTERLNRMMTKVREKCEAADFGDH
jgi:hypothetical protein